MHPRICLAGRGFCLCKFKNKLGRLMISLEIKAGRGSPTALFGMRRANIIRVPTTLEDASEKIGCLGIPNTRPLETSRATYRA